VWANSGVQMYSHLRKRWLARGLCWLLTGAVLSAAHADPFRRLMIDGYQVRWIAEGQQSLTLRYLILKAVTRIPGAQNCAGIAPPTGLLKGSGLTENAFDDAVSQAFTLWQTRINISFVETDNVELADIIIGEQTDPTGFAYAHVSIGKLPYSDIAQITKAAICLNPEKTWKIGFDGNLAIYDLVHTAS
jgi:hypothetical protein